MNTMKRTAWVVVPLGGLLACNLFSGSPTPTSPPPTAPAPPTPPTTEPTPTSPAPVATPTSPPSPTPLHGDWPLYINTAYAFEFRYPPGSTLSAETADHVRIDLPFAAGTNLREKYLEAVGRTGVTPCGSPLAQGYAPGSLTTETRTIAGLEFLVQSGGEGAAGNAYEWVGYSTTRGEVCASVSFVLHSVNAMNYTPPLTEFDKPAESAVFDEIMSTFAWLGS